VSQNKPSTGLENRPLVGSIDHCSLIVADTEKALIFYTEILDLQLDLSRPEMAYPGAWLRAGNSQIHLLEVNNPYSVDNRPQHGGRDFHVALQVSNLSKIMRLLDNAELPYTTSKSGRKALFCRDYDGNAIELVEK